MNNLNIPLYRAKKIDSDDYCAGYLFLDEEMYFIDNIVDMEQIDPTTIAIHFPDMLDSQVNKIFASLSEDGKGGDICYAYDFSYGDLQGIAKYKNHSFVIDRKGKSMGISFTSKDIKVIGIQK